MQKLVPSNRGLDGILSLNGIALGGQRNCILHRTMSPINITNKINGDWATAISGTKGWSVTCSGLFIKNQEAFNLLEESFETGTPLTVILTDQNKKYEGQALIVNFPVSAPYSDAFAYNISLLGVGELR